MVGLKHIRGDIVNKTIVTFGLRSIITFLIGTVFISFALFQLMNQNDPIRFVFIPLFTYLYIVVIFMSFSHVRFKQDCFVIRGDFGIRKDQIQKRTTIYYKDIKRFELKPLDDHINTRGEKLVFRFKYGNERAFIYGSSPLQCIEITHGEKIDCLVINKYTSKQVNEILEILKAQTNHI